MNGLKALSYAAFGSYGVRLKCEAGSISPTVRMGLQPDGDTFVVSSVVDPRLNGVPGPDLTLVGAFSNGTVGSDLPPTVSLSGSSMDIVACSTPLCDGESFFFDSIGLEAPFLFPAFYATAAYGGVFEGYEPVRWDASVSAPVSAPAPLAAMAVPGLLLLMRRRV